MSANDCFCNFFLMALCSLFTSQIYQPKIKYKDGDSYLYENQKWRPLEIEKKKLFSVNSFQKILIFHICVSSENAQCFVGESFLHVDTNILGVFGQTSKYP